MPFSPDDLAHYSPDELEELRELRAKLDKMRPAAAATTADGPAALLAAARTMPEDAREAIADALLCRLQVKRPNAAHPLVQAHGLADCTLGELGAAWVAVADGARKLPDIRAALSSDAMPALLEAVAANVVGGVYSAGMGELAWLAAAPLPDYKPSAFGIVAPADYTRQYEGATIASNEAEFTLSGEAVQLHRYRARGIFSMEAWLSNSATALRTLLQVQAGAAVRLIRKLAFAELVANRTLQDGTAQFAAGRGNLLTSKALTLANLDLAEEALGELPLDSGEPLDLPGRFLIVAQSARATADALNYSVGSRYVVVASAALTGASWWLLPSPTVAPTFCRAHLGEVDGGVSVAQLPPAGDRDVVRFDFVLATAVAPVSHYAVRCDV